MATITYSARSHTGKVRENNGDSLHVCGVGMDAGYLQSYFQNFDLKWCNI